MNTTPNGRRHWLLAAATLATACSMTSAFAQSGDHYPSRPIQFIVPYPAGGATDVQMRILAEKAGQILGQPIVVVNQPGVGGTLGPANMARTAKPDGYTISTVAGSVYRLPFLQKTTYDPLTDFSYIIRLSNYNFGIVVRADSPWKSVADVVAAAKANPDKMVWGGIGQNSSGHIGVTQLSRKAGFQLTYVPYKGAAPIMTDLIGGHIQIAGDAGWGPQVDSGKLRLLALMGEKSPQYPNTPTLRELGYDILADAPTGIAGPKGMPDAIVKKLHDAFRTASAEPKFTEALRSQGQAEAYMGTEDFRKWAINQVAIEKRNVTELDLKAE